MKCLLILDRYGYKINDKKYKAVLNKKYFNNEIIYTEYEDELIRRVRNWPFVGNALLHILRWKKSFGYALYVQKQKDVDTIICLNPIVGVILGLLPSNIRIKKIILCGFLFEDKNNRLYYILRKVITKRALKKITKVVVYSKEEVPYYEKLFGLKEKFQFVPYGIDYLGQTKYINRELPQKYIFSGGSSNRDYGTLINAYNNISNSNIPLVIATQPWRLAEYDTSRCIILSDVINETFGNVLERASLLILSLKDTKVSAGHMVMLQAMNLGIPILVNDIPSIRDYVDEELVTFYESGNDKQLSSMIIECLANEELNKKAMLSKVVYKKKYTSFALLDRLMEI